MEKSNMNEQMKDQLKKYHEQTDSLLKKAKIAKQKERTSKKPNFVNPKEEMPSAKKPNRRKRKRRTEAQELEMAYFTCGYLSNADGVETRSRKRRRLLENYN